MTGLDLDRIEMDAGLSEIPIKLDVQTIRALVAAARKAQRMEKALAEAIELLDECWQQWAIPNSKGELWAGGLSTLEGIEAELPRLRAALSPDAERGET